MDAEMGTRRGFLKKSFSLGAGVLAATTLEERILLAKESQKPSKPRSGAGSLDQGTIGKVRISRLICGGNLIGGWAHSGELVYVSSLMTHYFTDEKILETLSLCEQQGINTVVTVVDQRTMDVLDKHRNNGGRIQWIAQLRALTDDYTFEAKVAVDHGAVGGFLHGGTTDQWIKETGKVDKLAEICGILQDNGLIAGVGGHALITPKTCEKEGLDNDFYFKTLNTVSYWCDEREETVRFMESVKKPWIAYKVLGAGRVSPTAGFKQAISGGADFMCVGMFDFQVADDVNILRGILARSKDRTRPWRG